MVYWVTEKFMFPIHSPVYGPISAYFLSIINGLGLTNIHRASTRGKKVFNSTVESRGRVVMLEILAGSLALSRKKGDMWGNIIEK